MSQLAGKVSLSVGLLPSVADQGAHNEFNGAYNIHIRRGWIVVNIADLTVVGYNS